MKDLIKQVDFCNDKLIVIKDSALGKIYTGVNLICDALGLDARTQRDKLKNHATLSKGCTLWDIPSNGGNQQAYVIDLDFLPLWLASINPSKVKDEISDKLINYQLKAKDVLAAAFVNKQPQCVEDLIIMQAQSLKDMRLQLQETRQETTAVKQEVQAMKDVITIKPSEEWRKKTNVLINRICMKTKDYKNTKEEIYKALQERAGCDLKTRLKNMRGRLLLNGATQSKADSMNYLDVIAEDKKLIEIYTAIVKELAAKNSIQVKEAQYGKG